MGTSSTDLSALQTVDLGNRNVHPGAPGLASKSADPETLAARLTDAMGEAWQRGERPTADDFLAGYPELCKHPQAAVQLLYEELCLRQEFCREDASAEMLRRFPQWRHELETLLTCHRIVQSVSSGPSFPEVGETLGEFRLLEELERGAAGRVFVASQSGLADRPVVLKIRARTGREHISLARLQHTYVVPLYSVQDFPDENLRVLCMPFLGGGSLAQLLRLLQHRPYDELTGQDFLDALDRLQSRTSVGLPGKGPVRQVLGRASYIQAICWIGACLADALQYAHERGLVHLDIKPANVLIAGDAQPMLLDFHLARAPLEAGAVAPQWLGGTPQYMSPEQRAALLAVRQHRPVPQSVDGRSDIYSLGLTLYEALGGVLPDRDKRTKTRKLKKDNRTPMASPPPGAQGESHALEEEQSEDAPTITRANPLELFAAPATLKPLCECNPSVSIGLSDVIAKCLEADPRYRYTDAASLAADLRRHLGNLPLQGVPNRSVRERWQKWRRRRPHALVKFGMVLIVLAALGIVGRVTWSLLTQKQADIRLARTEAAKRMAKGEYGEAADILQRALRRAQELPGGSDLTQAIDEDLRVAKRAVAIQTLHTVAKQLRLGHLEERLRDAARMDAHCDSIWKLRDRIARDDGREARDEGQNDRVRTDLLDVAILWADLKLRLASEERRLEIGREALALLEEAERLYGPSVVLYRQRERLADELGHSEVAQDSASRATLFQPRSAWEHYALGRMSLSDGKVREAMGRFEEAIHLQPDGFWPHFYHGIAAYRAGKYDKAAEAFTVCIALSPRTPQCYYNRALAHASQQDRRAAIRDYSQALELDPSLGAAALNRALLHFQDGRHTEATADLHVALANGADPALVHYNLALIHLKQNDRTAALMKVQQALQYKPDHRESQQLRAELEGKR